MSCAKLLPYNGPRADEIEVEIRRLLSELLEQKIYTDKAAGFLLTLIMDSGYNAGNEEGTINDFSLPWRLRGHAGYQPASCVGIQKVDDRV